MHAYASTGQQSHRWSFGVSPQDEICCVWSWCDLNASPVHVMSCLNGAIDWAPRWGDWQINFEIMSADIFILAELKDPDILWSWKQVAIVVSGIKPATKPTFLSSTYFLTYQSDLKKKKKKSNCTLRDTRACHWTWTFIQLQHPFVAGLFLCTVCTFANTIVCVSH